ncbi:uncharacterized protein LOC115634711 [Scaptodrosophila lebanonensis]|uniref:Uncharacterized protein LOC115634711 n=1 Tax=Drosophila lebanonensis TaxID=7225 RepID=A0A6J2UJP9_DROLE|nr:uncharacterized protein LOC115634711 [Scaptodrosophila lebanonensis]XP_030388454.1 uncharacterized protein LOC115634711 [Scaptodrosophila lebanonensis]
MSITLDFNIKKLNRNTSKGLHLHYLPAKIDGDAHANVDTYFNNYTRSEHPFEGRVSTNALRGYPLLGEQIGVPDGFKAAVLQETRQSMRGLTARQLRLTGTFDKLMFWNYDRLPSNSDCYRQAMKMIKVSDALTVPVDDDEIKRQTEDHV